VTSVDPRLHTRDETAQHHTVESWSLANIHIFLRYLVAYPDDLRATDAANEVLTVLQLPLRDDVSTAAAASVRPRRLPRATLILILVEILQRDYLGRARNPRGVGLSARSVVDRSGCGRGEDPVRTLQ